MHDVFKGAALISKLDINQLFDQLANPHIVFSVDDPHFTIVAQNQKHAEITFTKPVENIGKPMLDVFPDHSEKFLKTGVSDLQESLRKVAKTGKPDAMPALNYNITDDSGQVVERWWRATHYPLYVDGQVAYIYQITADITSEIINQQKLEQAQLQLDVALGIGLVSTWLWDINSDMVIGDANLARHFGVDPDQASRGLPLQTFTDSIHTQDRKRVISAIQKSVRSGNDYEQEYRTYNSDGTVIWVIARGKIIKNAKGDSTSFIGIIIDITDRKEAEAELEQIKHMFDALFESTVLSIVVANLDGHILQANKTFLTTFGYTKADLKRGLTSEILTPIESRSVTTSIYDNLRSHGESEPIEKEYRSKKGEKLPMLVGAVMLPRSNDVFIAFMLDISENRELRALNQAKDEFVGMASHQLRTPATAVKQYLSLLTSGFGGDLTAEQQTFADKAFVSNERQLQIVNDLLKTAQIDSNHYSLEKQSILVSALVTKAVEELRDRTERMKQTLILNDNSAQKTVLIDPTEINLVIVNLIENASKYSPHGSKITVQTALNKKNVEISIRDNGVGIEVKDQKRIFEKFTRVDNALSDTVSGTGLGLYWVKRIINLHGGTIKVKSQLGKGSSFIVCLPYEQ